jgi:hypothetical protein
MLMIEFASDHAGNHLGAVDVGDCRLSCGFSITEKHDSVRNRENFFEAVADKNDGNTLTTKFVHDEVKAFDFVWGEGGTRFVHYEDARVVREGARDFNELLLTGA